MKRTGRRGVALLCLAAALLVSGAAGGAAARAQAPAKKVTITLVRWPYT